MNVIIVGAGIAGLSAGVGLRRAGHRVTILEQSSLLHEVGAAITIKPNASLVLKSWDFSPADAGMVAIRNGSLIDGENLNIIHPNYYKDCESKAGFPMYAVHRVDLHSQLRKLATQKEGKGTPCEVLVREKVVHYDAENARVTTAKGEVFQGDFIIAADGVHSKAPQYVLGHAVETKETGWACMRWLIPREELLSDVETAHWIQDSTTRYFTARGGNAGLVWYMCRNNEIQNFLYLSKEFDTSHVGEDFRAMVENSMPLEYGMKHFDPALYPVIKKARDVKFWKLVSRAPIPKWHKNKLLLIGDAAHPMLTFQGQGGGQAIEDGAALGVLFDGVTSTDTLEQRMQLFEQVRRGRGSALQMLSSVNPPASQEIRDAAASYLDGQIRLDSTDQVNDYVFHFDVLKESKAALEGAGLAAPELEKVSSTVPIRAEDSEDESASMETSSFQLVGATA